MAVVQISRDPFARCSLVRDTLHTNAKCVWCGENTRGRLFQYGTEYDQHNGAINWHCGGFCCKSCHDSYYE